MYGCTRCSNIDCHYGNGIHFKKVKTKYSIDEDIVLDYAVHGVDYTSSLDWIGIFPKGWDNIQQYLTTEFVAQPPEMLTLRNRRIIFPHTSLREVSSNVDYQFAYVNSKMQILAKSSYFHFVVPPGPFDQNSSTPDRGFMNDGHMSPIVSPITSKAGKILECSRSVDDVIQSYRNGSFEDQRQRPCKFCLKSAWFTNNRTRMKESVFESKIQFLLLHNEQLVSRMNRLARDLELTEAAVKSERTARTVLTKKLQAYETFITDIFKCLNLTGIVKIKDKSGKEVVVQKVKPKELSSMRDEKGDKTVPVLEISMRNQISQIKQCGDEEATKIRKTEEVPQESNLHKEKLGENEEEVNKSWRENAMSAVKKEAETSRDEKSFEITLSVEEQQPRLDKKTSAVAIEIRENRDDRGSYEAKEGADERGTVEKVKGEPENAKDVADDDNKAVTKPCSKCCCDCHSNGSKRFDNGNAKEWALECECDLQVLDRTYQVIRDNAEENCNAVEATKDGLSAILIKGRNAKFVVVKY